VKHLRPTESPSRVESPGFQNHKFKNSNKAIARFPSGVRIGWLWKKRWKSLSTRHTNPVYLIENMAQSTNIEWSDAVWNFLRGCSRISEGCGSDRGGGCYAERQAIRGAYPGGPYEGLVKSTPKGPRWTGNIRFVEELLFAPLRWKKPGRIFVNSMSDLFHEKVTDEMLDKAFAVMALTPQHTYQILTKRPERMKEYFTGKAKRPPVGTLAQGYWRKWHIWSASVGMPTIERLPWGWNAKECNIFGRWPLPNVWLGVSVEDQKTADERIPLLLQTPSAVHWLSIEPLLGPVDLTADGLACDVCTRCLEVPLHSQFPCRQCDGTGKSNDLAIGWVVVGGESGPKARPMNLMWVHSIVQQCRAGRVPVFVKQLGQKPYIHRHETVKNNRPRFSLHIESLEINQSITFKNRKGGDMSEWPEDLRIREFPGVKI
jgi:protein gp37